MISDKILVIDDDPKVIKDIKLILREYDIIDVMKNGKKIGDKLVLKVEHPDMPDGLEISGVKYQMKDKIKTSGLWINIDKDNKLGYNSATAHLLRHLKVDKIKELVDREVETTTDDMGFLVVKAY